MAALSEKVKNNFTNTTRQRGLDYFLTGAVKKINVDPVGHIVAQVQGSRRYQVDIDVESSPRSWTLLADCSCPYSETNDGFCKHIWATLLKSDFEGHTTKLGPVPAKVTMELGNNWDEVEDVDDESTDYAVTIMDLPNSKPRAVVIPSKSSAGNRTGKKPEPQPQWLQLIRAVPPAQVNFRAEDARQIPAEPYYILEAEECNASDRLILSLARRKTNAKGTATGLKKFSLRTEDIPKLASPTDRMICLMLSGAAKPDKSYGHYNRWDNYGYYSQSSGESRWKVGPESHNDILPLLFETGRFMVREVRESEPCILTQDEGSPWELVLNISSWGAPARHALEGRIRRGDDSHPLTDLTCLVSGTPGIAVQEGAMLRVNFHGCDRWVEALRTHGALPIQRAQLPRFLAELDSLKAFPPVVWPPDWNLTEVDNVEPVPELSLDVPKPDRYQYRQQPAQATVSFRYGEVTVNGLTQGALVADNKSDRLIRRQSTTEQRFRERLAELGLKRNTYQDGWDVPIKRIPEMVATLLTEGWTVLGNRQPYRKPGEFKLNVSSGIDWFELDGHIAFGDQSVALPELLAAARKGERFILLGDGSLGMLPEEWLAKNGAWLDMGQAEEDHVRFAKTQLGLIDALLAEMPDATFDAQLAAARAKLNTFAGIKPRSEPADFTGQLRDYQRDGLGWLHFLQEFGWGGCLADDMGLGKTVQLLAFLADIHRHENGAPSLVVAPKSLIFNWAREAQRFTPHLRVLAFTGLERRKLHDELLTADLVLTTYGTLRRDIETLRDRQFKYVVLDEAQAIKNPDSQNAKATRLLRADHRLVLTGTPVENHLGDLWSLFEFLNPGMLGTVPAFKNSFGGARTPTDMPANIGLLQRTLRPFILRRTKDQVARELPPRSEQTIVCEMGPKQSACYRQLRDHYRTTLLARVDEKGLAKSKIHVLEALLRLRQAACHPGLIDKKRKGEEAAKLESLFAMIGEFVEKGHKALIFSQFTSLLAIVRAELDQRGLTYEYLDGRTRKRDVCVDRFQSDPACPLFLISLKAGGTGLNLTAADYVFILDPWWNPAVEAQAIDRTHRIGQRKKVIAYRLIARDTVEEKILELQKSKRALADAIIAEQNSVIRDLSREDLAMLLS